MVHSKEALSGSGADNAPTQPVEVLRDTSEDSQLGGSQVGRNTQGDLLCIQVCVGGTQQGWLSLGLGSQEPVLQQVLYGGIWPPSNPEPSMNLDCSISNQVPPHSAVLVSAVRVYPFRCPQCSACECSVCLSLQVSNICWACWLCAVPAAGNQGDQAKKMEDSGSQTKQGPPVQFLYFYQGVRLSPHQTLNLLVP